MDFSKARQSMVDCQIRPNSVTDPRIVSALGRVAREAFVPGSSRSVAYSEQEIETSPGRALWIPRDFAKLLKALDPKSNDFALIIGAGAGYEAAVLAELVETVIGLDDEEDVINGTSDRLADQGVDSAVAVLGDLKTGLPDQGPFDLILVNGMVETVPDTWLEQLADGGRLGVIVANSSLVGTARIYVRAGDTVSYHKAFEGCPPKFDMFDADAGFAF